MSSLALETLGWAWDYVQHVVVMFYWFWVPAFLVVGALSFRYRPCFEEVTLAERHGARALWAAIGWGMTSATGRATSLEVAKTLWSQGVADHVVLAFLVASQNLALYGLVLLTVLIGIEFGLGVFLGGLVMIGLLHVMAPSRSSPPSAAGGIEMAPRARGSAASAPPPTWRALALSTRGWGHVLRDIGGYVRNVRLSLLAGLALGAFVLTVDTRGYWIFPKWMGDETLGAALAGSLVAPLLSMPLLLAPGGNLIVVSSIWKTWTLAYSGVVSFVLMSPVNPLTARTLAAHYGAARGGRLIVTLCLSAALGGLAVAGVLAVLGLQVTHVPWFRDLVDRITMTVPFTTLGAPGGRMKGM